MGVGALLALLALLVNIVAPPGFMVAPRGAGVAIVICTGHGPQVLPDQADKSGHKPSKTGHDSICAFAGHGLASPPPVTMLTRQSLPLAISNAAMPADLAPGQGLSAPPPPSQGPPVLV